MAKKDDSVKIWSKNGRVFYYYRAKGENDILIVDDKEYKVNFVNYGKNQDELMFYLHDELEFNGSLYPKNCILKISAEKVEFPCDRKKEVKNG